MSRPIVGILLAAGNSVRMGCDKLALPLGSTTIGSASLNAALSSALDHVIVAGKRESRAGWIGPAFFKKENWSYGVCDEASRGQAHTLSFGLRAAEQMNAQAAVILLADQPFTRVELINQIVRAYKKTKAPFVAACLDGIPRPPVLFSNGCFPVLQELKGDRGAGSLLKQPSFARHGRMIDCQESRSFFDIDTMQDYKQVAGRGWNDNANAGANICLAATESGGSEVFKERA
ncbi:NTP transferase domain-containing protein [Domibacillus sp. 8LH]|uniref:NTP transferase domain-containing protein n=1 Tax=Domibacillus sp. 8LH TaxID=3073900 RepID=UPI0031810EE7